MIDLQKRCTWAPVFSCPIIALKLGEWGQASLEKSGPNMRPVCTGKDTPPPLCVHSNNKINSSFPVPLFVFLFHFVFFFPYYSTLSSSLRLSFADSTYSPFLIHLLLLFLLSFLCFSSFSPLSHLTLPSFIFALCFPVRLLSLPFPIILSSSF